jgi:hypothetical protein
MAHSGRRECRSSSNDVSLPLKSHADLIRGTGFMEYRLDSGSASVCLDARELDHLGPLLGFVGDQLSELSRICWPWPKKFLKPILQ